MKDVFQQHSEAYLQQKSSSICERIQKVPELYDAPMVVLYEAMWDEPDLSSIVSSLPRVFVVENNEQAQLIQLPKNACFIVPGRAFTLDGKRVGRGWGWYDASLSQYPDAYKIGVCFDFQIFERLPQDSWDVGMDLVVSM